MTKQYSFWKLLRAQYSWKNDRISLFLSLLTSLILVILICYKTEFIHTVTGEILDKSSLLGFKILGIIWITYFLHILAFYHTVKIVIIGSVCWLLTYGLNNKKWKGKELQEMKSKYEEALTWRQ